jgi:hypothetical protein
VAEDQEKPNNGWVKEGSKAVEEAFLPTGD